MSNQEGWVVIARFGRPHGIKGFIKVHSFTEPRDNVLNYNIHWHTLVNKKWQPIKLVHTEIQNKSIITQIEGCLDRELVAQFTNLEIAIPKEELEELEHGEYYWHELIGMQVINEKAQTFGTILEIIATGANDVLVVQGEKKYLIPYLPGQSILGVDKEQNLITVDWDMDF